MMSSIDLLTDKMWRYLVRSFTPGFILCGISVSLLGCDSTFQRHDPIYLARRESITPTLEPEWKVENVGIALVRKRIFFAMSYGADRRERAYSIQQTDDGGYIVAGDSTSYSAGDGDVWILKLRSDGAIEWQKSFGSSRWDRAYSIQQTDDKGYIVAGRFENTGERLDKDFWILKLSNDGTMEWQRTYGGPGQDEAHSIQQTNDGGYIVAGEADAIGWETGDIWVLKLRSDGTVEWQKSYGGDNDQQPESIRQTDDGGYILAGATDSFGEGKGDIWVLKLESDGTVEWQKTYGGHRLDYAYSIQQTNDGGYIVAGESASFDPRESGAFEGSCGFLDTGCFDAWVLKLKPDGSIEWQKAYGGDAGDAAASIQQTDDGGYVVAGSTSSFGTGWADAWVLKLDDDGEILWQRVFGGDDVDKTSSIQQTDDGGYVVAGSTGSFGAGYYDAWVLRLHKLGVIDDCPLMRLSQATVTDTNVIANNTKVSAENTTISPGTNELTIQDSYAVSTVQCEFREPDIYTPRQIVLDYLDWLDRLILCLPKPLPGLHFPRCSPPTCPDCLFSFSIYGQQREIPEYVPSIYHQILPLLIFNERHPIYPESSIERIGTLFRKAPVGSNYTEKLKKAVFGSLDQMRMAKEIDRGMLGKLVEAANAIELDLSVPRLSPVEVNAGKYSAIDFEGVAWLAFKDLKKPGRASLEIKSGIPTALPGFRPPWPIFSYDFNLTGALAEDGYIDINFYIGGINFVGQLSSVHILEWDGKSYKDITINVDDESKVVTGRTNHLSTYVIMSGP